MFVRDFLGKERSCRAKQKQISFLPLAGFVGAPQTGSVTLQSWKGNSWDRRLQEVKGTIARGAALRVVPDCVLDKEGAELKRRRRKRGEKGEQKGKSIYEAGGARVDIRMGC